jgi:SsrA-binding protein
MSPVRIENRRARHLYHISDRIECGIELIGSEVKSIRMGNASIKNAYARVENGEVILHDLHIARYPHTTVDPPDPERDRKLLLKKSEIRRLRRNVEEKGMTLIPLAIYFNERGLCKVLLGVCRGKREFQKKEAVKERDLKRMQEREARGGDTW